MNNLFSKKIVKVGFYIFVIAVILFLAFGLKLLFFPLLSALLMSLMLEPIVNHFEAKGYGRATVTTVIFIGAAIILTLSLYILIPLILEQLTSLAKVSPVYRDGLKNVVDQFQLFLQNQFTTSKIPNLWLSISSKFNNLSRIDIDKGMAYISGFLSLLSIAVIVPIVSFFLLVEGHLFQKSFLKFIPNSYFELMLLLPNKVTSVVKNFIRGQLIDAFAVGALTAVGLSIIGVPYALVIGLITGVGNLIPYLGPLIGFSATLLVVLGQGDISLGAFLPPVLVFGFVQFIEGTFIYPIAVGKSVNLHPLVVLLGITVGGQVAGLLGMLLIIPLITIVKVTLEVSYSYLKGFSII